MPSYTISAKFLPSAIVTVTVIHLATFAACLLESFPSLSLGAETLTTPYSRMILAKDLPYCVILQILTAKECIRLMENIMALLYGGRVQNTLSKLPV
jgi:hypothetical protein